MGTVIIVVLVVVVLAVLAFVVALAARGKQRAAATLTPGAPPEWAGAHSPEAKLHRRLVAATRSLAALPLGDAAQIEVRVALDQQLRQLDEQLIAAAAIPPSAREPVVARIEPLVAAAEAAVATAAAGHVDLDLLRRNQREIDG